MLNFANILTMSRIAAIPAIVGLLLIQGLVWHWIALALFIVACVTDWFDGYVARRLDQVSPLGRFLDPIADKLVVAAVLLVLVSIGHIDGWSILAALVILCREILLWIAAAMTVITGYDYMTIGLKHMAASQPPKSQPPKPEPRRTPDARQTR